MSLRVLWAILRRNTKVHVKQILNGTNIGQSVRELIVNPPFIFYRPRFSVRFFIRRAFFSLPLIDEYNYLHQRYRRPDETTKHVQDETTRFEFVSTRHPVRARARTSYRHDRVYY